MDTKRIMILINRITHISEEYGAVSTTGRDKQRLDSLRDEHGMVMEEIRRIMIPPQSATATMMAQMQQTRQQLHKNLFSVHPFLQPPEEDELEEEEVKADTEIEFSL